MRTLQLIHLSIGLITLKTFSWIKLPNLFSERDIRLLLRKFDPNEHSKYRLYAPKGGGCGAVETLD